MNFNALVFLILINLVGLIYIALGLILKKYPPKNINHFYGYRTKKSMQSNKRWDFAQKYSAKKSIKTGLVLCLLSVLSFFVDGNTDYILFYSLLPIFFMILGLIYIVFKTEKALEKLE